MSQWNTVTLDNITNRFNATELAAYQAMQAGPQGLTGVLDDVVTTIRGAIKAGGNQIGPDGMIPDSLLVACVSMSIWLWITGFSENSKLQTKGREKNNTSAEALLEKVRAGDVKTEVPDAGTGDTNPAPVNAIAIASVERRQFTRRKTRGL